ncbi:hypothetical protein AGMMS49928_13920 [Spirochaetia bacterium]|nr:hypothetical protein AGMMS49928_13920 [Spirochaetia bacterium]
MSIIYRLKRKIIRTLFCEQWSILVCDLAGNILKHITPPSDRFWADPFPVEYEGKTYIFLEQQIGSGNGTLGYIELYPDLSHSAFVPILEKDYHLSFPCIFYIEQDGQKTWYMIPESHENKTIDLYRAIDFPREWQFELTLMSNINANDSVVFYHDAKWWLFTSVGKESNSVNKNLSVFYSYTFPSAEWISHPQNPICSDLGNSRMAGSFFINSKTGFFNRPSQNCIRDYGKETNINEIIELTDQSYRERKVKTILPEKDLFAICTHTINHSENYILRDIKTRRFRFFAS